MFSITIITLVAITILLLTFHIIRELCQDPVPPPAYRSPQSPAPGPPHRDPRGSVPPAPTLLPPVPRAAVPAGPEPPPYSEVTAKPFLYPLLGGPCPECGHNPAAQPPFSTRT
nr:WAS/WASL-interacting protein family member 2-like [Taeniopygia guttata]